MYRFESKALVIVPGKTVETLPPQADQVAHQLKACQLAIQAMLAGVTDDKAGRDLATAITACGNARFFLRAGVQP